MYFLVIALITLFFSNSSPLFCSEQTKTNPNFDQLITAACTGNESAVKTFLKNDMLYPKNHPYILQAYVKTPKLQIQNLLATKCDSAKIPQLATPQYSEQQQKLIKLITSCSKKKYARLKKVILQTSSTKNLAFIAYQLIEFLYSPTYSPEFAQDIGACLQALIDKNYIFQSMPEYAILLFRDYTTIIENSIRLTNAPHTIILWTLCANFNDTTQPLIVLLLTIKPECIQQLQHSPLCFLLYTKHQGQLFKSLCKENRQFMYEKNLLATINAIDISSEEEEEEEDRLNFLFSFGMHMQPLKNIWFSHILTTEKDVNPFDTCFADIIKSAHWKKQLNTITHRIFHLYNRQHLQQLIHKAQQYHIDHVHEIDQESHRFLVAILKATTFFIQKVHATKKHFWLLMLRDITHILEPEYTKKFYKHVTNNQKVIDYMVNSSSSYGIPPCKNITNYKDIIIQHTI